MWYPTRVVGESLCLPTLAGDGAEAEAVHSMNITSKKKSKKKKSGKGKSNGNVEKPNGVKHEEEAENEDAEAEEPPSPAHPMHLSDNIPEPRPDDHNENEAQVNNRVNVAPNGSDGVSAETKDAVMVDQEEDKEHQGNSSSPEAVSQGAQEEFIESPVSSGDTEARLEALANERSALREEVAQLRRSLEEIQGKHEVELGTVREQLEETQSEKEHADAQYHNLLGKVNGIRSQLGERLKADAESLSQARSRIEELEEANTNIMGQNQSRAAELAQLAEEGEQRSKELSSLRNRTNLSQQNWAKEREDLVRREQSAKEEFETARQAMQEWEILAVNERSIRTNLESRVSDLEEQLLNQREAYEKAVSERDSQSLTVDGLQRALQEIQEARKSELRELVENSQAQTEELKKQLQESQAEASEAVTALEAAKKEIERALPFEKEVKEKSLIIGKLRHEAVTLNDHLTKALRFLKKGKPDETIDKQLVTNHFLHFLALDRSDPKKFQILQIISALLDWTEEQREQAGLARPGASNPNLRTPISPWHRTPSTPALTAEFFPDSGSRKESLAELWSDFLEQEAQEGTKSRSTSISKSPKPT
ncbi:hypothetical protein MMC20_000662 [Loxospora ochrophaea]|nr:hypothetical protein [Loxospora ochrophaea]